MATPVKPEPKQATSTEANDSRENSSVRVREGLAAISKSPGKPEPIAERNARISHKVAVAVALLHGMSPLDARARVLASAVLRRDEVLIDAVLAAAAHEAVADLPATVNRSRRRT